MRAFRFRDVVTLLLLAGAYVQIGCGSAPPDAGPAPISGPDPDSVVHPPRASTVAVYDESKILDFKLTFTAADWAMFQQIHANPPPPDQRDTYTKVWVHCGFAALGETIADAACRPKGNPASWKDEKKPQFVIKFDHWDNNGRFLTLRALNLEANPYAQAPVRDRLGMWVMRQSGVKAPRVNHVRVYNNGALLGLYMNIEEIDKEFLQSQFPVATGNLYSQGQYLQTNTKNMPDTSRLTALDDLVSNEPLGGDHASFFTKIDQLVNISAMLSETAAEVVLPTGDNWSNGGTNYFYYDSPSSGKFYLLPWDLDTIMMDPYGPARADPYAFWGAADLVFDPNKLLQLLYLKPEWKKEFEDTLVSVRDTVYNRLPAYIDQVCTQIRPDFLLDLNHASTSADFDRDCAYLKQHVTTRSAYLKQTLQR